MRLVTVDDAQVEKAIVQSPMGMQQLVQVLDDREEQTRNQLLLLLLAITGRSHRCSSCRYTCPCQKAVSLTHADLYVVSCY